MRSQNPRFVALCVALSRIYAGSSPVKGGRFIFELQAKVCNLQLYLRRIAACPKRINKNGLQCEFARESAAPLRPRGSTQRNCVTRVRFCFAWNTTRIRAISRYHMCSMLHFARHIGMRRVACSSYSIIMTDKPLILRRVHYYLPVKH